MIAAIAILGVAASVRIDVLFVVGGGLPASVEVARLTRAIAERGWQVSDVQEVRLRAGGFTMAASPGEQSIIVIRIPGRPGYLMHGPFRWPAAPATFDVNAEPRRTVRGHGPPGAVLSWLPASAHSPPAMCDWTLPGEWECLGIPRSTAGVVLCRASTDIVYASVAAGGPRTDVEDLRPSRAMWGRLLTLAVEELGDGHQFRVRARRLYRPAARPNTIRFEAVADSRVRVVHVGPTAAWISGVDAIDSNGWLDIAVPGAGVARVSTSEFALGPPDLPIAVALERPMAIFGRVSGPLADPVRDTIVALYRFGDPVRGSDTTKPDRQRISVGETRTNADGAFEFSNLVPERYELVAVHATYGRATRVIHAYEEDVELRLTPSPLLRGRVVRDAVPQRGVPVTFVPDLAAFASSTDPNALRGGETRTGTDGRFQVTTAASGAGELRIGSGETGIRRIPVASPEALPPVTDYGDIELDQRIELTLLFDDAGRCAPTLTGPIGRGGLTMIQSVAAGANAFRATVPEPGAWNVVASCGASERPVGVRGGGGWGVVASCGASERPVIPGVIQIKEDTREPTVSIRWP